MLSVDLSAVTNLEHDDLAAIVAYEVDYSIIPLPDPILIVTC